MVELATLFASAFLAATILPFYSEVVLLAMLPGSDAPLLLWAVATTGNSLGALVNWYLGLALRHFRDRPWWPVSPRQLARAQDWFGRYGYWSLLFAWLPLGGDALPLVAGTLRTPLWKVAPLITIGKGLRYGVLVWLALRADSWALTAAGAAVAAV
jgi:membrane protein YqaA with SNARE-associated domain